MPFRRSLDSLLTRCAGWLAVPVGVARSCFGRDTVGSGANTSWPSRKPITKVHENIPFSVQRHHPGATMPGHRAFGPSLPFLFTRLDDRHIVQPNQFDDAKSVGVTDGGTTFGISWVVNERSRSCMHASGNESLSGQRRRFALHPFISICTVSAISSSVHGYLHYSL